MTNERLASAPERQFWFAEQMAPGATANRALGQVRITGPVDLEVLTRALRATAHRHEALRTAFVLDGRVLVRKASPESVVRPPVVLPAGTGFDEAAVALGADRFDIGAGDVHRTAVAPDAQGATCFLAVHHIAFDGLSHEVWTRDLAAAYARELSGEGHGPAVARPPAPVLDPARREELTARWRQALAGVPDLPAGDRAPSQHELARAAVAEVRTVVAPATTRALQERARQHAVSPFALVLTAYGRALSELTGAADFCVGTPVSTRSATDGDEVGCVLNTLPIRLTDLDGPDVLARVWATVVDALVDLDLPCDEIVRECRPRRSRRMPLFQALFAFQSWPRTVHEAGPVRFRTVPVRPLGAQAEVQMQVCDLGEDGYEGILQIPQDGGWAGRLDDLIRSFHHHLDQLLAPGALEGTR